MSKVFVFGVDEDSLVFDIEYGSLEAYFDDHGKHYCGIFLDEYMINEEKSVDILDKDELFDYDGGEVESVKYDAMVEKYDAFLKNNSDYTLVSFGIEYDSSFLLMKKNEFEILLKMAKEVVDLEDLE